MGEFIPFANYLIRPAMEQGESVAGFIFRHLGANGYQLNSELLLVLSRLYRPYRGNSESALEIIRKMIGENNQYYFNAWLSRSSKYYSHFQSVWASPAIVHVRICPICLGEKGFHLSLWESSLLYACPVHNCALLESCLVCGNRFKWTGLSQVWRCSCGAAVSTMRPDIAQAGMIELACLLVNAVDVALPRGMKRKIHKAMGKPYGLAELYAAMEVGIKIAQQLNPNKHFVYHTIFDKRPFVAVPKPTLGWATRLIRNSPSILVKRIRRLLTRYFRTPETFITTINKNDVLAQVVIYLDQQPDSDFKQRLIAAFFESINPYRCKLPIKMVVLYDLKLTDKEFKAHLLHFARWWTKVCRSIMTSESTIQHDWHPDDRTTIEAGKEESYIFKTIQLLLLASQRNVEVGAFLGFTHWWPIPESLHKPKQAYETTYRIAEHLMSLSLTELALAHDMVLVANRKTMKQTSA